MRIVLTFILFLFGDFLYASVVDTSTIDSNYRLHDFYQEKMVDTSVQLKLVEVKRMLDESDDEWVTGPMSGGNYSLGENYDSQQNINPKVAGLITVSFLAFIIYIIFRVRRSLRKDEPSRRR
ncbi:MAG: hypothetical protein P8P74_14360 [Crocinitomicaceae bacterium]|nr:hypothetical protein [Crocinitomicaceae bacterium]